MKQKKKMYLGKVGYFRGWKVSKRNWLECFKGNFTRGLKRYWDWIPEYRCKRKIHPRSIPRRTAFLLFLECSHSFRRKTRRLIPLKPLD